MRQIQPQEFEGGGMGKGRRTGQRLKEYRREENLQRQNGSQQRVGVRKNRV